MVVVSQSYHQNRYRSLMILCYNRHCIFFKNNFGFFDLVILSWMVGFIRFLCSAITGRPMMKFESGYTVETVFDGSKLGIEPYSVEVLPSGELMVLDSSNSNLYKISSPLSQCK